MMMEYPFPIPKWFRSDNRYYRHRRRVSDPDKRVVEIVLLSGTEVISVVEERAEVFSSEPLVGTYEKESSVGVGCPL